MTSPAQAIRETIENPLARAIWKALDPPRVLRELFDEDQHGDCLLYYARVVGADSLRWKIGITSGPFARRAAGLRSSSEAPLIFDPIATFRQAFPFIWMVENAILERFETKWIAGPAFSGQHECFGQDIFGLDALAPRDERDELKRLLREANRHRERVMDRYEHGIVELPDLAAATAARNELRRRLEADA